VRIGSVALADGQEVGRRWGVSDGYLAETIGAVQ
jgi:hypothetical protein